MEKGKKGECLNVIIIKQLYIMGKTQKWLGDKCGVTQTTISNIINKKRRPSKKLLYGMSEALNIPYETLEKSSKL